jgi:hypothetical protein
MGRLFLGCVEVTLWRAFPVLSDGQLDAQVEPGAEADQQAHEANLEQCSEWGDKHACHLPPVVVVEEFDAAPLPRRRLLSKEGSLDWSSRREFSRGEVRRRDLPEPSRNALIGSRNIGA